MYLMNEGKFINCIEDLREVTTEEVFAAIENLTKEDKKEEVQGDNYELIADGYFQQINQTLNLIEELKEYLIDSKKINRNTIMNKINEMSNTLENY